jgi:protein-S-isoprenylcysteine O-methyltransferase Ste14
MTRNHAGVWFPPPLQFLLPLLAAAAFHAQQPWTIADRYPIVLPIAGLLAIAIAVAVGQASVAIFLKASTTILPAGRPTTSIVEGGPYRFTRNPMYLAMGLAYAGLALLLNNLWALALLPFVLLVIDRFVIRREERYLSAAFGDAYQSYCSRVRRWI